MSKLTVLKENAEKAYQAADDKGKKLLADLFPGELVPQKITDRIKTFKDVLDYHKITEQEFITRIEGDTDDEAAYKRMKLITSCLNEGPLSKSQTWYQPVFTRNTGFGFSLTHVDYWNTRTGVGERLSFKTAELAIYAGTTFAEIYKPFMLILG